eukprot:TRINITY_DN3328_c0_g1_i1.p1 TRINITY_DN3328_c0_g1~~TRINITY_DN3328_c0_g1_i1.p1  ORF type:complete len:322 (-),score=56.49 TRINITY_DN3328_c0_g1_i1:26-991(-)
MSLTEALFDPLRKFAATVSHDAKDLALAVKKRPEASAGDSSLNLVDLKEKVEHTKAEIDSLTRYTNASSISDFISSVSGVLKRSHEWLDEVETELADFGYSKPTKMERGEMIPQSLIPSIPATKPSTQVKLPKMAETVQGFNLPVTPVTPMTRSRINTLSLATPVAASSPGDALWECATPTMTDISEFSKQAIQARESNIHEKARPQEPAPKTLFSAPSSNSNRDSLLQQIEGVTVEEFSSFSNFIKTHVNFNVFSKIVDFINDELADNMLSDESARILEKPICAKFGQGAGKAAMKGLIQLRRIELVGSESGGHVYMPLD